MEYRHLQARSVQLITGLGVVLFLIAVAHHVTELYALDGVVGPAIALVLDGLPALGLASAGYWLSETDLGPEDRWQIFVWCLWGGALFVTIMGLSLLVRAFEGRTIGEAVFPLLIASEVGAIAGYHTARARAETRRARRMSDALEFVNSLIRHDLRNDLNVIQVHADLIDTEDDPADTGDESDSPPIIAEKADGALTRIRNHRSGGEYTDRRSRLRAG